MYVCSLRCMQRISISCVVLNNKHLCGTCLEKLRKRLKTAHLGAEMLKGGGVRGGGVRSETNANYLRSVEYRLEQELTHNLIESKMGLLFNTA